VTEGLPSCATVFRDELCNLFPHDEDARHLRSQTFLLSEFLNRHAPDYQPPKLPGRAILHKHCHHKAVMKMTDEEHIREAMNLAVGIPDRDAAGWRVPLTLQIDIPASSLTAARGGCSPFR